MEIFNQNSKSFQRFLFKQTIFYFLLIGCIFFQQYIQAQDIPLIEEVQLKEGFQADIVLVKGQNFGDKADNVCAVLQGDQGRTIPMEVKEAQDNQLVLRLPAIPADAKDQKFDLMVGIGEGTEVEVQPNFEDVQIGKPAWIWDKINDNAGGMENAFQPVPTESSAITFHNDPIENGKMCLTLDRDWEAGDRVYIHLRIHTRNGEGDANGVDNYIKEVVFTQSGTAFGVCGKNL